MYLEPCRSVEKLDLKQHSQKDQKYHGDQNRFSTQLTPLSLTFNVTQTCNEFKPNSSFCYQKGQRVPSPWYQGVPPNPRHLR